MSNASSSLVGTGKPGSRSFFVSAIQPRPIYVRYAGQEAKRMQEPCGTADLGPRSSVLGGSRARLRVAQASSLRPRSGRRLEACATPEMHTSEVRGPRSEDSD